MMNRHDTYKNMMFWVETYKNGILVDDSAGLGQSTDQATQYDGQIVIPNSNSDWTFKLKENGVEAGSSTMQSYEIKDDTLTRGYKSIDAPVDIENNKEIILFTSIYAPKGMGVALYGNQQDYLGHPELIKSYPYVQFIKCKFSK